MRDKRPPKDPARAARKARNALHAALIARSDAVAELIDRASLILIHADYALDQARRLAFACYFDGRTFEDQAEGLGCDQTAREIAGALEGLTPPQAVQVLERVRWASWNARYHGRPLGTGATVQ